MASTQDTGTWTQVMEFEELWEGEMVGVQVGATNLLVLNVDGALRVYENRCPHQASPLDEGDLDGTTLTCARHLWEFDAMSGNGLNPDDCALTSFPCRVTEEGMIEVELPR